MYTLQTSHTAAASVQTYNTPTQAIAYTHLTTHTHTVSHAYKHTLTHSGHSARRQHMADQLLLVRDHLSARAPQTCNIHLAVLREGVFDLASLQAEPPHKHTHTGVESSVLNS